MSSRRQDYISYSRYRNQLPLPPFPPKILNIPIPLNKYTETSYLSSLIQEEPVHMELDPELGMPLDLSIIPGVFEGIYDNLHGNVKDVKLDPKDIALLKEVSSTPQRNSAGVSFLRRTEYISSEGSKNTIKTKGLDTRSIKPQDSADDKLESPEKQIAEIEAMSIKPQDSADDKLESPEKQIAEIEAMFENVSKNLSSLTHPHKKDLTVVDSFPIFPDIDISDQQLLLMKFTTDPGQKTVSSEPSADNRLDLALFMPVSERGEEWLAYYLPEEDSYFQLKETLENQNSEENKTPFLYNHIRNYDTTMHINQTPFDEIVLVFRNDTILDSKKGAFYSPIYAKSTLKKRRSKFLNGITKGLNVSNIELKLRPLNEEEKREKKRHCSAIDPYNYPNNDENKVEKEEDIKTTNITNQSQEANIEIN
ncbi:hypothetical protein PORY_001568 [Pneumocystis oryctolagi]|uniref:Uncharacterized protein n=1 Tax=Pneumocystis oryctolagi TaxID=42067 RepID=A0ACB7CD63_9ASCO|nr:hypothetical protein PORY_001568 [Pneumocystis oryctolagi]